MRNVTRKSGQFWAARGRLRNWGIDEAMPSSMCPSSRLTFRPLNGNSAYWPGGAPDTTVRVREDAQGGRGDCGVTLMPFRRGIGRIDEGGRRVGPGHQEPHQGTGFVLENGGGADAREACGGIEYPANLVPQ